MWKKDWSPLVDVAMNYVDESNSNLSQDALTHIRSLFTDYINESISYDKISFELKKYLLNLTPLIKINNILNITSTKRLPSFELSNKIDNTYYNKNPKNIDSAFDDPLKEFQKCRKKVRSWAIEEDYRLLMGVHLYGVENWNYVSDFVGNGRTSSMCSQRWLRVLDPKISKDQWTEEENQKLLSFVGLYGTKSWMKIATKLGNRSDVQCRYHYKQLQKKTKEEELTKSKLNSLSQSSNINNQNYDKPSLIQLLSKDEDSNLSKIESDSYSTSEINHESDIESNKSDLKMNISDNLNFDNLIEQPFQNLNPIETFNMKNGEKDDILNSYMFLSFNESNNLFNLDQLFDIF